MRVRVEDRRRQAGSIVIANPNAPTGVALPRAEIAQLVEDNSDIPAVIDEAYVDFGGESARFAVPLIADHPNLLVLQAMSKPRALASLRVVYALGDALGREWRVTTVDAGHRATSVLNGSASCCPRTSDPACRKDLGQLARERERYEPA
jgi:histidinol-phosphate/aromatic aminotransferase/cobyric acid decarboxylase-like protein